MSGLEGMSREELLALVGVQAETIESLRLRVAELERQLAVDSSTSLYSQLRMLSHLNW